MYAISNVVDGFSPAWRAIDGLEDLLPGELPVTELPDRPVWDEATGSLRSETPEAVEQRRQAREAAQRQRREQMRQGRDRIRAGEPLSLPEIRVALELLLTQALGEDERGL